MRPLRPYGTSCASESDQEMRSGNHQRSFRGNTSEKVCRRSSGLRVVAARDGVFSARKKSFSVQWMKPNAIQTLVLHARTVDELTEQITDTHDLFVQIVDAWRPMGYRTFIAARRAATNDRLGVPVVLLPGRRSRVIRSKDLAEWLFEQYKSPGSPRS